MTLLSTAEAARRLGITGSGLRRLIGKGRIAARRVGRAWVIEESALAGYRRGAGGWPTGRPRTTAPPNNQTNKTC